jgi:hypothetical protein
VTRSAVVFASDRVEHDVLRDMDVTVVSRPERVRDVVTSRRQAD